jgi:hypothetical protein
MHKVRCILALSLLSLTHTGAAHGQWAQMNGAGGTVSAASTVQKPTLKVVKVDSEEADCKGAYAVDGNPNTIWHTQWRGASPPHPHEIILQLNPPCKIKGLTYLPRQKGNIGTIESYAIYLSAEGKEFGQPVKKGEFFPYGTDKRIVLFDPTQCAFIKLVALSEMNGRAYTSAAEIGVIQEDEQVPEEIVIRSGLALAIPERLTPWRDPIEAQLVAGTFAMPKEGASPFPATEASDGKPPCVWTAVTANANGVFEGGNYSTFAGGWIYATVDSAADHVMLLEAYGHRSVLVNGDWRGGNEIPYDFVHIPVELKAGVNEFLFSIGVKPIAAKLVPPPAAVFISDRDILAPSLVAGRDTDGPVGVLVVNASVQPRFHARANREEDSAALALRLFHGRHLVFSAGDARRTRRHGPPHARRGSGHRLLRRQAGCHSYQHY